MFLFDAEFLDRSHYTAELIIGTESSGKRIEAVWIDVSQPLDGPLYPQGLLELLPAAPQVTCSSGFPGKSALPPRQMPQTVDSSAPEGAHMSDQRPSRGRIRLLALAVIRDGPRLLVQKYKMPNGNHFYRPLGGAVEFGERSAQTVQREIREEIGAEIEHVRYLATLENIFRRERQPAHWIALHCEAAFVDRSLYSTERIIGIEASGKPIEAVWVDLSQPLDGSLYPQGLLELLTAA